MVDFIFLEILEPFHDPSCLVQPGRRQLGALGIELLGKRLVDLENPGGGRRVGEEIADDLHVIGGANAEGGGRFASLGVGLAAGDHIGILRRVGGRRHQPAEFRMFGQGGAEELAGAFQDWIILAQECLVPSEFIMHPEVLGQPGAAGRTGAGAEIGRRGITPRALGVETKPARRVVVSLGGRLAWFGDLLDEAQQRKVAIGEAGDLGGPVVHLQVDVAVEIAIPGSLGLLGPDPLQVGRQLGVGTGTGNQQMPAELEEESGQ